LQACRSSSQREDMRAGPGCRSADRGPPRGGAPAAGRGVRRRVKRVSVSRAAQGGRGMTFAHTTGVQEMQARAVASQFVEGLDYPISKAAIIAAAREASVGPTLEEALKKLPDRE